MSLSLGISDVACDICGKFVDSQQNAENEKKYGKKSTTKQQEIKRHEQKQEQNKNRNYARAPNGYVLLNIHEHGSLLL